MASILGYAHLGLLPRCGACADTIFRHERIVALYGNEDSTVYRGHTRPFVFPQSGYSGTDVDGFSLCRTSPCAICLRSPEFIPIHHDCFRIFIRECPLPEAEALAHLWTIGSCRSPWPKAQLLHLTCKVLVDSAALFRIAEASGLKWLSHLPLELVESIRQQAPHEIFWRAVAVVSMAARVATSSQPSLSFPLGNVEFWERGSSVIRTSERPASLVQLTIDTDGIQKIERLLERPAYRDESCSRLAYIVEEEESLSEVEVHTKDDFLRLRLPLHMPNLQAWDTSAPPALDDCVFYPALNAAWKRFRTVNLSRIQGITFLFSFGQISGIHAHDSPGSSALSMYQRFSNNHQKETVWIYLPIAKRDRVIALGSGQSGYGAYILVRTELTGDGVFGTPRQSAKNDQLLDAGWPITLIHGDSPDNGCTPFIGVYRPTSSPSLLSFGGFQAEEFVSDLDGMYYSSAPLDNIAHTLVFRHTDTGLCLGILLQYKNGGACAVGQCRLHVDPSEKYINPSRICLRTIDQPAKGPKQAVCRSHVTFERDDYRNPHDNDGWQCHSLNGVVKFWFSPSSTCIEIHGRSTGLSTEELRPMVP